MGVSIWVEAAGGPGVPDAEERHLPEGDAEDERGVRGHENPAPGERNPRPGELAPCRLGLSRLAEVACLLSRNVPECTSHGLVNDIRVHEARGILCKKKKNLFPGQMFSLSRQLTNLERKWQHHEQNNFVMKECILLYYCYVKSGV